MATSYCYLVLNFPLDVTLELLKRICKKKIKHCHLVIFYCPSIEMQTNSIHGGLFNSTGKFLNQNNKHLTNV